MKIIILVLMTLLMAGTAQARKQLNTYVVEITNLTKGQPMTPAVVSVHRHGYEIFSLGEEASEGLKIQSKDGGIDLLKSELNSSPFVRSVANSEGILLPGQTTTVEIQARPHSRISITSMLARTNDAIVAGKNIVIPRGRFAVSRLLKVYDAGAEINNESCDYIPAPPCNSPNVDTEGNEGFIHIHPGVLGVGDLDLLRDVFGFAAARITIKRKN